MAKGKKKNKKAEVVAVQQMDEKAYEAARSQFIERWSQLMVQWGFPKALGTVHACLLTQEKAASMKEVREATGVSQGTAYTMLRRLRDLGLAREDQGNEEREVRYAVERDAWQVALAVLRERRAKELEPLLELQALLDELPAASGPQAEGDAAVFAATLGPFLRMAKQVDGFLTEFTVQDEKGWKRLLKRWISRA